jgi:hypothetical protein
MIYNANFNIANLELVSLPALDAGGGINAGA